MLIATWRRVSYAECPRRIRREISLFPDRSTSERPLVAIMQKGTPDERRRIDCALKHKRNNHQGGSAHACGIRASATAGISEQLARNAGLQFKFVRRDCWGDQCASRRRPSNEPRQRSRSRCTALLSKRASVRKKQKGGRVGRPKILL